MPIDVTEPRRTFSCFFRYLDGGSLVESPWQDETITGHDAADAADETFHMIQLHVNDQTDCAGKWIVEAYENGTGIYEGESYTETRTIRPH